MGKPRSGHNVNPLNCIMKSNFLGGASEHLCGLTGTYASSFIASFFIVPLLQHFLTPLPCSCYFPAWRAFSFLSLYVGLQAPSETRANAIFSRRSPSAPSHQIHLSLLCVPMALIYATYAAFSLCTHECVADAATCLVGRQQEGAHTKGGRTAGGWESREERNTGLHLFGTSWFLSLSD